MSKITGIGFYESLNKFIMGFLIFVLVVGQDSDLLTKPQLLISAYIVGCIYQALVQRITKRCLSLHEDDIRTARDEVYRKKKISYSEDFFLFIKELFCPMFLCRLLGLNKSNDREKGSNSSKKGNDYLLAYYKVAKAGLLMNIPVLEALENFMRNLIPIVFVCIILFIFKKDGVSIIKDSLLFLKNCQCSDCIYKILSVVLLILIRWLRRYYQQAIYRLVWEGNKYLDEINSETK